MDLVAAVLAGERLALARLLTQVENDTPEGRAALERLFPHTGRAHLVGVTGAPGVGKSSLVNRLAQAMRRPTAGIPPVRVGVVAVDPSSPFTGGALLGDRVRMRDVAGDPGVFIRSMASRGALGGLARATAAVVNVLDAAGYDVIFIETVGAGQSEVDIARLAHTTIVVEAPGMGDDIQAIKAGILEIADILVVNKADRPGADLTERVLKMMIEMGHPARQSPGELWLPPVLRSATVSGQGAEEIVAAIRAHGAHLRRCGDWARRDAERLQNLFEVLARDALVARWRAQVGPERMAELMEKLARRAVSPYEAVTEVLSSSIFQTPPGVW